MTSSAGGIALVVPVKSISLAKSRTGLPRPAREELVLELVEHTVATASRSTSVDRLLVVTPDARVTSLVRRWGAEVVDEPPGGGLDAAARLGMAVARRHDGIQHVGVLMSDLPHVAVDDLDEVVEEYFARPGALFVADQHGTGTTFLLQRASGEVRTAFGVQSARRHHALGFRPASAHAPGLRFDVDTPDDLRRARTRRSDRHARSSEATGARR